MRQPRGWLDRRNYFFIGLLLIATTMIACEAGPSKREVALRATVEALRDEVDLLRAAPPEPQVIVTPSPTAVETSDIGWSGSILDTGVLDWHPVNKKAQQGVVTLEVNALLLGQDQHGGPFGSSIQAGPDTKIILSDIVIGSTFDPSQPSFEIRVEYFSIEYPPEHSSIESIELPTSYRGLPLPMASFALPDRFFLSPGQSYRGVVAFIVPKEMTAGTLSFTNYYTSRAYPGKLSVVLADIP